jgi:surface protein
MFSQCQSFNQDISTWDTSGVTNMNGMLQGATIFNQPIGNWNTSNVIYMDAVFFGDSSFNQTLGNWNIGNVISMQSMLDGTALSIVNYDSTLNGWAAQTVIPGVVLGAAGLYYDTIGLVGRNILIDPSSNNWTITGDTFSGPPICYNKGTKILVLEDSVEIYKPIEELKPGDLVETYLHGALPIELINSKKVVNNPNIWNECMYVLKSTDPDYEDLVVTGGHGILKLKLTRDELKADKEWFVRNKKYSVIDGLYVQRAAFSSEFKQLIDNQEYTYYHFSLRSPNDRRYGIWANGVLSESTFKEDMVKIFC